MKKSTIDIKHRFNKEVKPIRDSQERESKLVDIFDEEIDSYINKLEENRPGFTAIKSDRPFDAQTLCANADHDIAILFESLDGKKCINITEFNISEIDTMKLCIQPNDLGEKVFNSRNSSTDLTIGGALVGGVGGLIVGAVASEIIEDLFPKEYKFVIRMRIKLKGGRKLNEFEYMFVIVRYHSEQKSEFEITLNEIVEQTNDILAFTEKHFNDSVEMVSFFWW